MTIQPYEPLPPSVPGAELERGPVGMVARLRAAAELANFIAGTDFVPEAMRDNPAAITAAILYGGEVGLEPMQALAKVAVIRGRPTLTAEAQRALILARGHEIWFEESTITRCIAAGRRAGSDRIQRITFTMDDAKRAGVAGQHAYRQYPAEMLRARASAALARTMFADVLGGLAAAEELEAPDNGATPEEPVAAQTPATGRSRRRPARGATEPPNRPALEPPPEPAPPEPHPEEPAATDAMRRKIFALLADAQVTEDRAERLELLSGIVGRELASTSDLTANEVPPVVEYLEGLAARRMAQNEQDVQQALLDEGAEPVDPPPRRPNPETGE